MKLFSKTTLIIITMMPSLIIASPQYNPSDVDRFKTTGQCQGCDLTRMSSQNISIQNANVEGSLLTESNISHSHLANSNFKGTHMLSADLEYGNFSGSNFSFSNLMYADLHNANFSRCDFSNVNITGANLAYSVLVEANITQSQLATAKSLSCTIMPDGNRHVSDSGKEC